MSKALKIILGIVILVIIVGLVFVFGGEKKEKEAIKIGVILPLTGGASVYGVSAKEGIDLAMEDVDLNIGLIYEDSQCSPEKSVSAIKKLIEVDEVKVIIGHICSSAALATVPITEENKVILFSPGASSPKLTNAGEFFFRNRQSILEEVHKVAEIVKNFNIKKAAVIYVNNDYGAAAKDIFVEQFDNSERNIVAIEAYQQDTTDFRSQLTKIKQQEPEAIFLAGLIKESPLIIKQSAELDIKSQFFSTIGIEGKELLEIAGDAAEGIIYTAPYFDIQSKDDVVRKFIEKYKTKYNKEPTYVFAANGYDALKILELVIKKCNINTDCIKNRLYEIKNYPGVSGLTTFDENGDVSKPTMIKTIKNGQFVPYKK